MPNAHGTDHNHSNKDRHPKTNPQPNEPLSGSKKAKNRNHSRKFAYEVISLGDGSLARRRDSIQQLSNIFYSFIKR